jgi:hypothetical protein
MGKNVYFGVAIQMTACSAISKTSLIGCAHAIKFSSSVKKVSSHSDQHAQELDLNIAPSESRTKFPSQPLEQLLAVRKSVTASTALVSPQNLLRIVEGRNTPARNQRITKVLENLVATGNLRMEGEGDEARYFAVR